MMLFEHDAFRGSDFCNTGHSDPGIDRSHIVGSYRRIHCDNCQIFASRLRHEHAVKGIVMMRRQATYRDSVIECNRK